MRAKTLISFSFSATILILVRFFAEILILLGVLAQHADVPYIFRQNLGFAGISCQVLDSKRIFFLRSRVFLDSLTTTCFFLVSRSTSWMLLDFLPRPGFHWELLPGSWFLKNFLQKIHFFRTFCWELDVSWISWHYLDFFRVFCYELDFSWVSW